MPEEPTSGLDAVESGPASSDAVAGRSGVAADDRATDHPTVLAVRERFPDAVLAHEATPSGQHVVFVHPERNLDVLEWLESDPEQHYDLLADLTAVDYGGGRPLQVVYQLWSIPHRRGLRIKCELPLDDLEIDSVVGIWATANWLEREVYDMFGIEFRGHPDLRRILMPENYAEGHPLRKDFPLRGRFSRAEQTRRALSQDPRDHYVPEELEVGGAPERAEGAPTGRPELPARDSSPADASSRDASSKDTDTDG